MCFLFCDLTIHTLSSFIYLIVIFYVLFIVILHVLGKLGITYKEFSSLVACQIISLVVYCNANFFSIAVVELNHLFLKVSEFCHTFKSLSHEDIKKNPPYFLLVLLWLYFLTSKYSFHLEFILNVWGVDPILFYFSRCLLSCAHTIYWTIHLLTTELKCHFYKNLFSWYFWASHFIILFL